MMKGDLTEENQRDLEFLQMRRSLDPKSHYRRKDRNVLPKYFEVFFCIIKKLFKIFLK